MSQTVLLGDIADVTKLAGFEFTKYVKYREDGEIIALRALNLRNGALDLRDIKRIPKSVSNSLPRSKLFKGDILLSYTGTVGNFAMITENDTYHLAPNVCRIRASADCIPEYLYYVIATKGFQESLIAHSHGSTQATVPMKNIRQIQIPLPDMAEQMRIISVLQPIDGKIALNRRMNETLEQMGQTLFTSHFIDSSDAEQWGSVPLGSRITPRRGKSLTSKQMVEGDVPVVSGGLQPAGYHNVANTRAPVITISASGANAGFVRFWATDVWSADSSYIDQTITEHVYFYYLLLLLNQRIIYDMQTGAAQPHIYPSHLERLEIPNAPVPTIDGFNNQVAPLFTQINVNTIEIHKLTEIRDRLLSRLMSGQIHI